MKSSTTKWIKRVQKKQQQNMQSKDILNYSNYKIQHALWIQQKLRERYNPSGWTTNEQYMIDLYESYLSICSIDEPIINKVINFYRDKINPNTSGGYLYNEEFHKNINNLIDTIIQDYISDKQKFKEDITNNPSMYNLS